MTDHCTACEKAKTNPYAGEIFAGCRGCDVRSVSNAPQPVRERYYAGIRDEQKRHAFMHAVVAEYKRRKALEVELREAAKVAA